MTESYGICFITFTTARLILLTMTTPTLGPVLSATIISAHYQQSIEAWCQYLGQHLHSQDSVTHTTAQHWGYPDLAGQQFSWLANELGEPWLKIVDSPNSSIRVPFTIYGWLSLEVSVQDVDELYKSLLNSPFKIIGEPANLDVSNDIRAMQVVGPDGEVLYLTEVKAEVPPFELPFARCAVDRLFIPVAIVKNRDQALKLYHTYAHTKDFQFDTKITVINQALGLDIEQRHPVATVQLAGKTLVELDEVADLDLAENHPNIPITGISFVSFAVKAFANSAASYQVDDGPHIGQQGLYINDHAGQSVELIQIDSLE